MLCFKNIWWFKLKSSKDGHQPTCKICRKIYRQNNKDKIKLKDKEYNLKNSNLIKIQRAKYREKNRAKLAAAQREYIKANEAEVKRRKSEWKKKNIEKINLKIKNDMKNNPSLRLKHNLRSRMRQALKKDYKSGMAIKLLGCSIEYFKQYIQSLWIEDMSWKNYGQWHLDHIIPIASIQDDEQCKIVCHYKNIRPLWASDNLSKGSKII